MFDDETDIDPRDLPIYKKGEENIPGCQPNLSTH